MFIFYKFSNDFIAWHCKLIRLCTSTTITLKSIHLQLDDGRL